MQSGSYTRLRVGRRNSGGEEKGKKRNQINKSLEVHRFPLLGRYDQECLEAHKHTGIHERNMSIAPFMEAEETGEDFDGAKVFFFQVQIEAVQV